MEEKEYLRLDLEARFVDLLQRAIQFINKVRSDYFKTVASFRKQIEDDEQVSQEEFMEQVVQFVDEMEAFLSQADEEIDEAFKKERQQLDSDLDDLIGYHKQQRVLPSISR